LIAPAVGDREIIDQQILKDRDGRDQPEVLVHEAQAMLAQRARRDWKADLLSVDPELRARIGGMEAG
jgi:hypothetical protein